MTLIRDVSIPKTRLRFEWHTGLLNVARYVDGKISIAGSHRASAFKERRYNEMF